MNKIGAFMVGGTGAMVTDTTIVDSMTLSGSTQELCFRLIISVVGGLLSAIVMPWLKAKFPEVYDRKKRKKNLQNGEN